VGTGDTASPHTTEVPDMDWKLELIALPVADVDRSIAFYVDRLGWLLDRLRRRARRG
jgi:predicted enzyme related to lactoylglutathione lyase